jgi:hypothetical protein
VRLALRGALAPAPERLAQLRQGALRRVAVAEVERLSAAREKIPSSTARSAARRYAPSGPVRVPAAPHVPRTSRVSSSSGESCFGSLALKAATRATRSGWRRLSTTSWAKERATAYGSSAVPAGDSIQVACAPTAGGSPTPMEGSYQAAGSS